MSIATLISWLTVTLNPFTAYMPVEEPVTDVEYVHVLEMNREPTSGGGGDEGDEDDREQVKPYNPTFSISNGF